MVSLEYKKLKVYVITLVILLLLTELILFYSYQSIYPKESLVNESLLLQANISQLQSTYQDLSSEKKLLDREYENLSLVQAQLEKQLEELKENSSQLSDSETVFETQITKLENENLNLKSDIATLENTLK